MMASEDEPVYCLCRLPYDETLFMIECDVCKDWFHGGCVSVQEHQAADIEIFHCPNCAPKHGPLVLKKRRNWHRHDYSEDGSKIPAAVQTGTVVFVKDLKKRSFPSADDIPVKRVVGYKLTASFFDEGGFDVPIVCEKKEGLGLTLPPPSLTINDVEQLVGSMREIDVIDVARQDDIKMIMREWTEYYNSPNREKILNVISLEFSNTRLSEFVSPPTIVSKVSWAKTVWPEQLPEDSSLIKPEVQKYCLMGVKDSFTDFHIDFGGTSVWYHVLRGEKVFYLIRPTQENLELYETWLSSAKQSETFFGDRVDKCYRIVVKQGHTLFIPTGWIHAVLTPIDSLVFGGNFLHNYNVPLQLQCYEIEKKVKTPEKYLFPSYETMNWYAAKLILDLIKDYTEEKKLPPTYLIDGARSLSISLKAWTHRKDYAKVSKQDVADYIQYGKVLKDLAKEVKTMDAMKPPSPKKTDLKRKRGEKQTKAVKKVKGLDVLEEHTQELLKAAEKTRRESIYNFEDEEDDGLPLSLTVRIPKAGAYQADGTRAGARESRTGAKDAKTGAKDVKTGAKDVKTGAKDAKTGAKDAKTGTKDAKTGAKETKTGAKETKTGTKETKSEAKETKSEAKETNKSGKKKPKSEMKETKSEVKETKLEMKETKSEAKETNKSGKKKPKSEMKKPKSEVKESKSEMKETKSEVKETKSEVKETKSEMKETKTEVKETKSKMKETKSKMKETKSKMKETKSEVKEESAIVEDIPQDTKGNNKTSKSKKGRGRKSDKAKGHKGGKQKELDTVELPTADIKPEDDSKPPLGTEIPQCLKFKLSNGKMVSTDRKSKPKRFRKKEFMLLGADIKDEEEEEEGEEEEEEEKAETPEEKPKKSKTPSPVKKAKKEPKAVPTTPKKAEKVTKKVKGKKEAPPAPDMPNSDSDGENLVVDENPKKPKNQKTTSTTKPASLKMKLPPGSAKAKGKDPAGTPEDSPSHSDSEIQSRLGMDTIRGGLNGSISDILTASGYGTETSFKVDGDNSGMRDAIAGMLTMSRMGHDGEDRPLFSRRGAEDSGDQFAMSAADEEKQLMADCYEDNEFVYPSFELSDDEDRPSKPKPKKKPGKDDNWNPKARIHPTMGKPDRDHREGVQKKSMTENLAATATKLAENPPNKKAKKDQKPKPVEKREFEVQPLPGPSTSLEEDPPVNAFRPGIKRPVDPCAVKDPLNEANKSKKPKKGFATAKQRLGKLLKIRKMVY